MKSFEYFCNGTKTCNCVFNLCTISFGFSELLHIYYSTIYFINIVAIKFIFLIVLTRWYGSLYFEKYKKLSLACISLKRKQIGYSFKKIFHILKLLVQYRIKPKQKNFTPCRSYCNNISLQSSILNFIFQTHFIAVDNNSIQ